MTQLINIFQQTKYANPLTKYTSLPPASCMGLLGIALAFLVANLGTLFQVGYSISGALVSPLDGLFVTGILAPWVNEKASLRI